MIKVGIVGASGYTGAELLRLLAGHPDLDLAVATGDSQAGQPVAELYPNLAGAYGARTFDRWDPAAVDGLDLVFCGLPHGASQAVVPELRGRVGAWSTWPPTSASTTRRSTPSGTARTTPSPSCSPRPSTACPSCSAPSWWGPPSWPAPAATRPPRRWPWPRCCGPGWWSPPGSSSTRSAASRAPAGPRSPTPPSARSTSDVTAYGLLRHRHTPEIEQTLTRVAGTPAQAVFTPHLVPMSRGMLATCYSRPVTGTTASDVADALAAAYDDEAFVSIVPGSPSTKATLGSNTAHVTAHARRAHRLGPVALRHRQPGQGRLGRRRCSAPTWPCGLPEGTGLATVGTYP